MPKKPRKKRKQIRYLRTSEGESQRVETVGKVTTVYRPSAVDPDA